MYNNNFYDNFHGNNFAFQNNYFAPSFVPPPPFPPPSITSSNVSDEDFVKQFDRPPPRHVNSRKHNISISAVKANLRNLIVLLNYIKETQKGLSENVEMLSDTEWSLTMKEIERNKVTIAETMTQIDSHLDVLRKLLAKRSSKRLRLKRVALERKKEKEDRLKMLEERSRKIDENLQKIQDDIGKVKQEEESKHQADVVLKEVLRKKHDAKKCIVKLDALIKLRKARQNTAKGRGEAVSEKDADTFNGNVGKLKSLWIQKLALYEKEETDIRSKLKDKQEVTCNEKEREISGNLDKWREFLFGNTMPQVDFHGNLERFVAIRSQWDQFASNEGTPLPVGWVLPD